MAEKVEKVPIEVVVAVALGSDAVVNSTLVVVRAFCTLVETFGLLVVDGVGVVVDEDVVGLVVVVIVIVVVVVVVVVSSTVVVRSSVVVNSSVVVSSSVVAVEGSKVVVVSSFAVVAVDLRLCLVVVTLAGFVVVSSRKLNQESSLISYFVPN